MNVLFITIDSLRYDHFNPKKTPKIFNEIKNPITFTNAVSNAPATPSSFRSMLTGCYWRTLTEKERKKRMAANTFRVNGYKTLAVQSNTILIMQEEFREGFDIYEDTIVPWLGWDRSKKTTKFFEKLYYYYKGNPTLSAKATTDKCLKLLENTGEDFFCWQHYMNVHVPYFLKGELNPFDKIKANKVFQKSKKEPENLTESEKKYLSKAYKKEVERVDDEIARLLRGVKDKGLWDDTIIIITSDHGDGFGLHGRYSHPSDFIYEETTHIPILIRIPGAKKKTIDEVVGSIDLKPTLTDLLDFSTGYKTHGTSLLPLLKSEEFSREGVLTFGNGLVSIRTKDWKYIFRVEEEEGELYDLREDPDELNDLSEEREDKAFELHQKLKARLNRFENLDFEVDDHDYKETEKVIKNRLRDLGYLD